MAVTFLTVYNGFFIGIDKNNKFYFLKSFTDDDGYVQISLSPGAYEIESLNKETKRINIDEEHYTESNYPFTIKPNFPTLASFITISTKGPIITFVPDDSIRDRLGLNKTTLHEEHKFSPNPVDFSSFDNIF